MDIINLPFPIAETACADDPDRAESIMGVPVTAHAWNADLVITPEQAKRIIDAQPNQRSVRPGHVAKLAQAIRTGDFRLTHQGVAFDRQGRMFDGQHRLLACILSGMSITIRCNFNADRSTFPYVDGPGGVRTDGDILHLSGDAEGSKHGNIIAAALRIIWQYDNGLNPINRNHRDELTYALKRKVIAQHPEVIKQAKLAENAGYRGTLVRGGVLAAFSTLFFESDARKAETFFHQLHTGEGLYTGDPVFTLRTSLMAVKSGERRTEIPYRLVRAWNAFYAGRKLQTIYGSISPRGQKSTREIFDVFPRIAGYTPPLSPSN